MLVCLECLRGCALGVITCLPPWNDFALTSLCSGLTNSLAIKNELYLYYKGMLTDVSLMV